MAGSTPYKQPAAKFFSPASEALYRDKGPKIRASSASDWLSAENLTQFIEFIKAATGDPHVLAQPTLNGFVAFEPVHIAHALRTWSGTTTNTKGHKERWSAATTGYAEGKFTFAPYDANDRLVAPYVNIHGSAYSFYITGQIESKYNQEPRVYPALHLHGSENGRFHITMHPQNNDTMFLDNLYHANELGEAVGVRLSAVDVFQFIKNMGYKTVMLSDASSIAFMMPADAGPQTMYFPSEHGEVGNAYEYVNVASDDNPKEDYIKFLDMSAFNVVKHIILKRRTTLRVYGDARDAAQHAVSTITSLEKQVAAHARRLNHAEIVVQHTTMKQSPKSSRHTLLIKLEPTEPGAPQKAPQQAYLERLKEIRMGGGRRLSF